VRQRNYYTPKFRSQRGLFMNKSPRLVTYYANRTGLLTSGSQGLDYAVSLSDSKRTKTVPCPSVRPPVCPRAANASAAMCAAAEKPRGCGRCASSAAYDKCWPRGPTVTCKEVQHACLGLYKRNTDCSSSCLHYLITRATRL